MANNNKIMNSVKITGRLIESTLEEKISNDNKEYISGAIKLRTSDNSEHEIQLYSNKYKKDSDEVNSFYSKYCDFIDNHKSLKNKSDDEEADIIRISDGTFQVNDFKNQSGQVVTFDRVSARNINYPKTEVDDSRMTARFTVDGVINSIKDELSQGMPTGNLIVDFYVIGTRATKQGNEYIDEVSEIIPIKLTVEKDLAEGFRSFYTEGCYARLNGEIINKAETTTEKVKPAFGKEYERTFTNYKKSYKVVSGDNPIYEYSTINGFSDEIFAQLKAKRKAKLIEVESGVTNKSRANAVASAPKVNNPFAGGGNPFGGSSFTPTDDLPF